MSVGNIFLALVLAQAAHSVEEYCAASTQAKEACVAGWKRHAAAFIPVDERRVESMVGYYLDTRLRAPPEQRDRFCRPLR